jgi:hypothetical protein
VALTAAGLALHEPGAINLPSLAYTWMFVALMAVAGCIYLIAVALILRRPMPAANLWVVLAISVALRAVVLPVPPFLSSDMFRYVWDGKVQNAGISPYRFIPNDPALTALRDGTIYPHIGRVEYARTIYPPMAQLLFRAEASISPTVLGMKTMMVAFELLGIVCTMGVLAISGLPLNRILIYAWNPLALWVFAGNGHVDAIAIGLIGAALLAWILGRDVVVGVLLGAAIAVKFLPLVVTPAFWRRWDWRMPTAAFITLLALYSWYSNSGWQVLGFVPGYLAEEGISRGSGIWLLAGLGRLASITVFGYLACAAAGLLALAAYLALRPRLSAGPANDIARVSRDAAILGATTVIALSPHYAWYYPWLALLCCIYPLRSVIYLSVAGLLLYVNPLNEHFLWPCLVYIPAIALAVRDLSRRGPELIVVHDGAIERTN